MGGCQAGGRFPHSPMPSQAAKDDPVTKLVLSCALSLAICAPAFAQGTASPNTGPGAAQPAPNSVNEGDGSGKSLSRKLSESGGVITPKQDVDPAMKAPAPVPQPNSTPVIPPSATGGNTAK